MNIDKYSIFFLDNVDIDLLVFLEIFQGNEGVEMASHFMVFLHYEHAFHLSLI
jgi:ABC-type anion transport system duplicated permease subunit